MQYDVKALSMDPRTGDITGAPRVERIDTATNDIFRDCEGPWDVEDHYEAFWNRLNSSWEHSFPSYKDKVLVLSVEAVA